MIVVHLLELDRFNPWLKKHHFLSIAKSGTCEIHNQLCASLTTCGPNGGKGG
jgi:hypothetical protein